MKEPLWQVQILTLFPELYPGPLDCSLIGRALKENLWTLDVLALRDFGLGHHKAVDDTPYGGGAGMVLRADVLKAALDSAKEKFGHTSRRLYLSPRGRVLDQNLVKELAACPSLLLVCGRFEGVDQRVLEHEAFEEVSLGDFILAGGDLAAMALCEACVRLLDGVMGNAATKEEESFENFLLEYPHYTRPPLWEGLAVPEVLSSGHHANIAAWRLEQARALTREKRPDLWKKRQDKEKSEKNG
ncbi:MAG: tRNA (guanosine(37)-N1)-methyltransferase TrmD [Alphaproteobacteria bacterium]|nr:tRNA (guanosine(37)-N1)-methyltransferase TrmD [Alphaproteobacteria bacterium]